MFSNVVCCSRHKNKYLWSKGLNNQDYNHTINKLLSRKLFRHLDHCQWVSWNQDEKTWMPFFLQCLECFLKENWFPAWHARRIYNQLETMVTVITINFFAYRSNWGKIIKLPLSNIIFFKKTQRDVYHSPVNNDDWFQKKRKETLQWKTEKEL